MSVCMLASFPGARKIGGSAWYTHCSHMHEVSLVTCRLYYLSLALILKSDCQVKSKFNKFVLHFVAY